MMEAKIPKVQYLKPNTQVPQTLFYVNNILYWRYNQMKNRCKMPIPKQLKIRVNYV